MMVHGVNKGGDDFFFVFVKLVPITTKTTKT